MLATPFAQPQPQERPLPAIFELRPEEDRDASIKAGHPVMKDVEYAIFIVDGGRLKHEKKVADFSPQQRDTYAAHLNAWRQGLEAPPDGTPIRGWVGCTPAQAQNLIQMGVRTVEGLAEAPDTTIQRFGMGGVALRQKARTYLEAAAGPGKLAEQMEAMKIRLDALEAENREKQATIDELDAALRTSGKVARREKPGPATGKA